MKSADEGYALRAPSGVLVAETFDHQRTTCWFKSYDFLGTIHPTFHRRYYKKMKASQAWARRNGWRMVKVKLVRV